jgi:hypothetical protein
VKCGKIYRLPQGLREKKKEKSEEICHLHKTTQIEIFIVAKIEIYGIHF